MINAALANKSRFDTMTAFFDGVGEGYTSGIWQDMPQDRPEFRKKYAGMLAAKVKAEEAIGMTTGLSLMQVLTCWC